MLVLAVVEIDGVEQYDESIGIASFVGDECRDAALYADDEDGHLLYVLAPAGSDNEVLTFRLWNETTGEALDLDSDFTLEFDEEGAGFEEYVRITFTTPATTTFELPIIGYSNDPENPRWYLIASPVGEVNPAEVENMLADETEEDIYDLYYFDQANPGDEWVNRIDSAALNDFNLMPGQGYLYANKYDTTLRFTGTPYTEGQVFLSKHGDEYWKAWNLVGNPFGEVAYIGRPYYRMNETGTDFEPATTTDAIEVMEGIFVVAEDDGETLTFTTEAPTEKGATLALNLTQGRAVVDRAIVSFSEGSQLPKMQLNPNHTKVYMPVEGKDYAVVNAPEMGEMPVSFKAEKNGTYTLGFTSNEVSFNYLHLIDNMTGIETDLLATPSYTFNAQTTDYASRFKLVFATGNSSDDNFAFYTNGSFVVSNEGNATLQVVDVMGRILTSKTINGSASVNVDAAAGVYMLRLVNGNNVKVQKVVVK